VAKVLTKNSVKKNTGHFKQLSRHFLNGLLIFLREGLLSKWKFKMAFAMKEGGGVANCPAVFLSYFSLWICYEIQPAVGTPYTAVQNVWTISPARNHQFESSFWLKRLAIYM